jgi:hypothetical protein
MPENTDMSAPITLAEGYNPFGDEGVVPQQAQPAVDVTPTATNESSNEQVTAQPEQQPEQSEQQNSSQSFDPNEFVRERFGFESVEEAENQFRRLKEEPSFEFKDDVSKTLFDAIKEGKADDVYQVLNQQKKLERLTTAELDTELAIEVVKENLRQKHKELNEEEVELLFYDKFFVPLKPEQGFDETDEDYANKVKAWEAQVDYTERKLMIEAKTTRSELAKLKSEIQLPDIYNEAGRQAQFQEEYEMMQYARSNYEKTLDSDFKSFNGFSVSVKDEDVEIPISFNVGDEEKSAMKSQLEDFDTDSYFEGRWFNEDGKPNVQQIMADKYLLENRDKIFSKIANEAASQRLLAHLKKSGNININQTATPQGAKPDLSGVEAERQRLAEWAFSS